MENNKIISIVYIDDDQDLIDLVILILKTKGYQVFSSNTGQHGLNLVQEIKPDIILLDIMMPDMDGWEVFQALRSNPSTQSTPVIMITAKSQPIDKVLGLQVAGVNDYLTKPFLPQQLIDGIENVLHPRD